MKIPHLALLLIICASSAFCNQSAEHKKAKPSRSMLSSTKNGFYRTRKTIAALSECVIGGGILFCGARGLPGSGGSWCLLKRGDKAACVLYSAGTIISVSLLLDGIEELNKQVDLANRSRNMLKTIRTFLTKKAKAKN